MKRAAYAALPNLAVLALALVAAGWLSARAVKAAWGWVR